MLDEIAARRPQIRFLPPSLFRLLAFSSNGRSGLVPLTRRLVLGWISNDVHYP